MVYYTLLIDNVEIPYESIKISESHPSADCDTWEAEIQPGAGVTLSGDGSDTEVEIQRNGTTIFKGLLETVEKGWGSKKTKTIKGRHTKVKLWRSWSERNEGSEAYPFWKDYFVDKIVKFYIHPCESDAAAKGVQHMYGWGIRSDDWTCTAISTEAGTTVDNVKDRRFISGHWSLGDTQATNDWFKVDLDSSKTVAGIRIENRLNDEYIRNYKIQYSTNDSDYYDISGASDTLGEGLTYCNIVEAWTPLTARYIRIWCTGNNASDWTITEIFVYTSGGDLDGISEGTLDADKQLADQGIGFPWMRRTELLYKLSQLIDTSDVPWETWIDNDGAVHFRARRGSDKSSTINFRYSAEIAELDYSSSRKSRADRVKVLGKGQGRDQDIASSDWTGSGSYELIVAEKSVTDKAQADARAEIIQSEQGQDVESIRTKVDDVYDTNDWGVGDDITLTEINTEVSGAYRVKKVMRKYSLPRGEEVTIEASTRWGDVMESIKKLKSQFDIINRGGDSQLDNYKADEDIEKIGPAFILPDILFPSPQENLVLNAGFERDSDGDSEADYWTSETSNGTVALYTLDSLIGKQCIKLSVSNVSGYARVYSEYIPITPSTTYFCEADFKCELASNADVLIRVYWYQRDKSASSTPSTDVYNGNGATSWGSEEDEVTSPADAYYARVVVGCDTPTSLDGGETYVLFDDITFSVQRSIENTERTVAATSVIYGAASPADQTWTDLSTETPNYHTELYFVILTITSDDSFTDQEQIRLRVYDVTSDVYYPTSAGAYLIFDGTHDDGIQWSVTIIIPKDVYNHQMKGQIWQNTGGAVNFRHTRNSYGGYPHKHQ